jgi:hypothetical protein
MTGRKPDNEPWRRLYEAAKRVKAVAPWDGMEETDFFGVRDPDSGEIGFVSVMGLLGEHFAVAAYRGLEGLYGYWEIHAQDPAEPGFEPERIMEVPQIQASFEDRDLLETEDRAVIRSLGLRFRGRNAWPMFRSYRPGYFPWFLDAEEARFMTHVLEQSVGVAERFREDDTLLDPPDEESCLVRVPRKRRGGVVWEDRWERVPPPTHRPVEIRIDGDVLDALERLPVVETALEVDCFLLPAKIGEVGVRPLLPRVLLMVDAGSGLVLGNDIVCAEDTIEAMWAGLAGRVGRQFLKIGSVPREIHVASGRMADWLALLALNLGIEISAGHELRHLHAARLSMLEHMT